MRKLVQFGLMLTLLLPAAAAQRITVQQLELKLAAGVKDHDSAADSDLETMGGTDLLVEMGHDSVLAPQIESFELSERLTANTLARLAATYKVGPQSLAALQLLADRSALLDPPASELPTIPAPDADALRQMTSAAGVYVLHVLLHLPNFFATRTSAKLDDAPLRLEGQSLLSGRLHPAGTSRQEITFRDGKEVINPMQSPHSGETPPEAGLESQGEFGAELATVFLDVTSSTLAFHHWEQASSGPVAVFRYVVPSSASHYQVNYSCTARTIHQEVRGYHGSLSIDPASGAIWRITLEVDSADSDPLSHVASVIEYGRVSIGGRSFICPVRSLAFMVKESDFCTHPGHNKKLARPVTMLNRITFTDYHRLGSTSRILPSTPSIPEQ
jgi:hypothetical protein